MPRFAALILARLVLPCALFFSVPAIAQFEIAPDHFDSTVEKSAAKSTVQAPSKSTGRHHASPVLTATAAHPTNNRTRKHVARHSQSAQKAQRSMAIAHVAAVKRKSVTSRNVAAVNP